MKRQFQAYLLRLWREGEESGLRILVENAQTHERLSFPDLSSLTLFLNARHTATNGESTMTFQLENEPQFNQIIGRNKAIYQAVTNQITIHHDEIPSFTSRARTIQRDLNRQIRNNVQTADLKALCELIGMPQAEFEGIAEESQRLWGELIADHPELKTASDDARQNMLYSGLSPSNPIIELMADLTGLDAEMIYQAWMIHIGDQEVPPNASCNTICDLTHAGVVTLISAEHLLAIWKCSFLAFPVAILLCMGVAATSYAIQLSKAKQQLKNCQANC